jgi:hypothetical protein
MKIYALAAGAMVCSVPAAALAGPCEDGFVKKGSAIGGLKFTASITVPDLTPASAIYQMKGLALGKGYDVLTEEAEDGSMLIEQSQTQKARSFPIIVTATTAAKVGTLTMQANLRGGMMTKDEAAKAEMCSMLNQLKGGKAGLVLAAKGRTASAAPSAPTKIGAMVLSMRLSGEKNKNPAAIPLRYKGKSFTIDGTVDAIAKDGDTYRIDFYVPEPHEQVLRLPGQANFKTDISCLMAKGQAAYSLSLKPKKSVKLTGTFHRYRDYPPIMWLSDCRPAE